jgi:hypothetical protein
MFPLVHFFPQPPQLLESFQMLVHFPLQQKNDPGNFSQHTLAQVAQLNGSDKRSTQLRLQQDFLPKQ